MSILSQVTPSIQVINVQKRRELHVWPSRDRNGATIELTEISIPEKVMTISIEHQDLDWFFLASTCPKYNIEEPIQIHIHMVTPIIVMCIISHQSFGILTTDLTFYESS